MPQRHIAAILDDGEQREVWILSEGFLARVAELLDAAPSMFRWTTAGTAERNAWEDEARSIISDCRQASGFVHDWPDGYDDRNPEIVANRIMEAE